MQGTEYIALVAVFSVIGSLLLFTCILKYLQFGGFKWAGFEDEEVECNE